MLIDTESFDFVFIHSFGSDKLDLLLDLPFIAGDFFAHYYPDISRFSSDKYADDDMTESSRLNGFREKLLNMLLAAARRDEDYAQEMLCRLYKIYYKAEYNQLKRFHSISLDELLSFENDEELVEITASRILTLCPFLGISIEDDCEYITKDVEEFIQEEKDNKGNGRKYKIKDEILVEAHDEAERIFERLRKKGSGYLRTNVQIFKEMVLSYLGKPDAYDMLCSEADEKIEARLFIAISLVKSLWPDKTFSADELLLYYEVYENILSNYADIRVTDQFIDMMLGRTEGFAYELERRRYNPEKQKISVNPTNEYWNPEKFMAAVQKRLQARADRYKDVEEAEAEIEHLNAELKTSQQSIKELNEIIRSLKEEQNKSQLEIQQLEKDRGELHSLREFAYSLTEEDLEVSSVPVEDMEATIKEKKVIIVGGHDNWFGFLKEKFPDWTYIKPSASGTIPETIILYADYLFFFTDTISHSSYSRYINAARKHKVPFSYLHGTNIENTIRSIYDTLKPR